MKNHVLVAILLVIVAVALACGPLQWKADPPQHISCIHGPGKDATFFDATVTDVEWHGTEVTFVNAAGAEVTLHVPTQVCAVFPAPAASPSAEPPAAPSPAAVPNTPPVTPPPVAYTGPVKGVDAGPAAK